MNEPPHKCHSKLIHPIGTWIELKQLSGWKEAEEELLTGGRIGPRLLGGS
jgi:hypothetical protein